MTPAEQLAAARGNVVGPYVPAREEWLEGSIVPIRWRGVRDGPWRMGVWGPLGSSSEAPVWGIVTSTDGHDVGYEKALDLTRPEVQDHLVRGGAPAWARDIPAALWVWATGVEPKVVFPKWVAVDHFANPWERAMGLPGLIVGVYRFGWRVEVGGKVVATGPETGPEGMACADVAALRIGCILEEPDG